MDGSDDDLMERVAAGDRDAFAALVERHLDRVVAIAGRIVGNRSDAEDIAQEALLRLWRTAPQWRHGEQRGPNDRRHAKLSTWLYRVTANLCIDHHRKPKMQGLACAPEPIDDSADGFDQVHQSQTAMQVQNALAALPARQRAAFALCHYEGMSQAEAASVLDVSVKAVESLLTRARRQLRTALAELVETNESGQP